LPNCRRVPEDERRAKLESLGMDPESLCGCHRIRKGKWDDGRDRTFVDECNGKAFRADGFVSLADAHRRFTQLSRSTWEAQQRCLTPDVEGLVHKWINDRHRIPMWMPYAVFGPIYRGWDWGGQNPHAVVWFQKLSVPVGLAWQEVRQRDGSTGYILTPILSDTDDREIAYVIPEGALVQFDEHYGDAGQLGEFSTLGKRVVLREEQWRQMGFPMDVEQDFCDPAGYVAKREVRKAVGELIDEFGQIPSEDPSPLEWLSRENAQLCAEMGVLPDATRIRVPEFRSIPAPRVESIRKHIELGEDDMLYIVPSMCPGTDDEYDVYHWLEPKPGRNAPEDAAKEDDHALDAVRYLIWNLLRIEDRQMGVHQPSAVPRETQEITPGSLYDKVRATRDSSVPEPGVPDGPGADMNGGLGSFRQARTTALPSIRR
jgi:hypothetical protein